MRCAAGRQPWYPASLEPEIWPILSRYIEAWEGKLSKGQSNYCTNEWEQCRYGTEFKHGPGVGCRGGQAAWHSRRWRDTSNKCPHTDLGPHEKNGLHFHLKLSAHCLAAFLAFPSVKVAQAASSQRLERFIWSWGTTACNPDTTKSRDQIRYFLWFTVSPQLQKPITTLLIYPPKTNLQSVCWFLQWEESNGRQEWE